MGCADKARFVLGEMERRMAAVGGGWSSATGVQVYTVHRYLSVPGRRNRGARCGGGTGVTWHFARPPMIGLEYEMDCRAVATERVVAG